MWHTVEEIDIILGSDMPDKIFKYFVLEEFYLDVGIPCWSPFFKRILETSEAVGWEK